MDKKNDLEPRVKKENLVYEFSASLNRFYFFFAVLNFVALGLYLFSNRYNTPIYIVLILMFDAVLIKDFFDRKHVKRISINLETGKIIIVTSFLPMLEKKFFLTRKEITVSYKKEKFGRVAKGMVLKIKDVKDNLIGKMTPQLSYWDKKNIEAVNEILNKIDNFFPDPNKVK